MLALLLPVVVFLTLRSYGEKQRLRMPSKASFGDNGDNFGDSRERKGARMSFHDFCHALYVRRAPLGSQTKFIHALFTSAGSAYLPDVAYCKKLFSGKNPLSQDIRDSFADPIPRDGIETFLRDYLTKTGSGSQPLQARCTTVAHSAGTPATLTIDPDAFVPALGDWFQAIIKNPTDCDILATAYQRRLEGEDNADLASFTPLYAGDRVIVSKPPSQQTYSVPFWGGFSHEWVLQNTGTLTWSGRSLHCVNPTDNGVRPNTDEIPVRDTAPQGFAKVACNFETRGREGKATSQWQMVDTQGGNCFPNHSTTFDVTLDVINPNAPGSEAK